MPARSRRRPAPAARHASWRLQAAALLRTLARPAPSSFCDCDAATAERPRSRLPRAAPFGRNGREVADGEKLESNILWGGRHKWRPQVPHLLPVVSNGGTFWAPSSSKKRSRSSAVSCRGRLARAQLAKAVSVKTRQSRARPSTPHHAANRGRVTKGAQPTTETQKPGTSTPLPGTRPRQFVLTAQTRPSAASPGSAPRSAAVLRKAGRGRCCRGEQQRADTRGPRCSPAVHRFGRR